VSTPLDQAALASLNPGIREVVAFVRSLGLDTCDSGDGRTHEHLCDQERAYVAAQVAPEGLVAAADRLRRALCARGIRVASIGLGGVAIQASYDPANGVALVELTGLDDAALAEDRP